MDSFAHPTTGAEVGEWGDVSFSRSIIIWHVRSLTLRLGIILMIVSPPV